MWSSSLEQLESGRILKVCIHRQEAALRYLDVLRLWQQDAGFRSFYLALLAGAPFSAYRWETPPLTTASLDQPFEFVLLDSPGLARRPDREAFASHFQSTTCEDGVVVFPNLGNDAVLVVPCPLGPESAYGHLAAFVRAAPPAQQHALWQAVGRTMLERPGSEPVWLSTAGAGVSWLHVRLDARPKYYGFAPYRASAT